MAGHWVTRVSLALGLAASVGAGPVPPLQAAPTSGEVAQPTPTVATSAAAASAGRGAPAPGPGNVLLSDDFSDPTSGWPRQSESPASRRLGYEDGEYLIARVAGSGGSPFVSTTVRFDNCLIEIDARLIPPTDGAYVYLDFRRQSDGGRYSFVVNPNNGTFLLRRYQGRGGTDLLAWTRATAINEGTARNRLGVRLTGSEIVLLINGQQVGQTRDDTYSEGQLAFGVGHFHDGAAEARFGNLVVSAVSSTP